MAAMAWSPRHEGRRGADAQVGGPDGLAQGPLSGEGAGAIRALLEVALERQGARQVELAVEIGREGLLRGRTAHRRPSLTPWAIRKSCKWRRARARRDITVPMGMPTMAAISL